MSSFFNDCKTVEDAREKRAELLFKYHPDVSKEDFDTNVITNDILTEYAKFLRSKALYNKDHSINRDVEKEMKVNKKIYVVVFQCTPRYKDGKKYYDYKGIKSFLVGSEEQSNSQIINLKKLKIYNPYLSNVELVKCNKPGFVFDICYGGVVLNNFHHFTINDEQLYRPTNVMI